MGPFLKFLGALLLISFSPLSASMGQDSPPPSPPVEPPSIQCCFTPPRGCLSLILKTISQAQQSIHVQAYSFTSGPITQGLKAAHNRGVSVQIILDKSQVNDRHSRLHSLAQAGIPIFIDPVPGIAHNKVMIIDEEWVISGSYNFTNAAETRNAENVLLIRDKETATSFLDNWRRRRSHSYAWGEEYVRPGVDLSLWVKETITQLMEWIE